MTRPSIPLMITLAVIGIVNLSIIAGIFIHGEANFTALLKNLSQ